MFVVARRGGVAGVVVPFKAWCFVLMLRLAGVILVVILGRRRGVGGVVVLVLTAAVIAEVEKVLELVEPRVILEVVFLKVVNVVMDVIVLGVR